LWQEALSITKTTCIKRAEFWLCVECERAAQQILPGDLLLSCRAAFRFVDYPSFLSPSHVKRGLPRNPGFETLKFD
jgi:hypothetical protein